MKSKERVKIYFALMKIQAYRRIENIEIVNLHVVFPQNYTHAEF